MGAPLSNKAAQTKADFARATEGKTLSRQVWSALVAFVAVLAVSVGTFLVFYNNYNDRVLYNERLSQMSNVTTQLFAGVDDVVASEWNNAAIQINYLCDDNPKTESQLARFMSSQYRLSGFSDSGTDLVAVDEEGRYYTQEGDKGALDSMNALLGKPDRVSFVNNTMTSNEAKMLFLERLETPLAIDRGGYTVKLTYYGLARNMVDFEPYFSCESYDGNNSVYVIDSDGAKVFGGGDSLLKGHNVFNVLGQMDYLHGSSFDKTRTELESNGVAYSNAVLDGEEYYLSLRHMDNAEWTLLFLVPAKYVATNTVALVNTTVRLVMTFAVLLVAVCSFIVFVVLRSKQRQILAVERRNNEELAAINSELDIKNEQLVRAAAEAQEARAEAEASSHAKSDFLANMSHDIRTPMNVIVGVANLMEHEQTGSERLDGYIKKIQLSSHHMLSLINDILDMSKIESAGVSLRIAPVSLAEQVGQVDSIIRAQTNARAQSFMIYAHHVTHEHLLGDGLRLRQVFLNLLTNAVKYTPEGGSIVFDISEEPSDKPGCARFVFKIVDNGIGMDEEFQNRIFEPFSRAEESGTNKVQGTGLGMAITKNIVGLMGGLITVQSALGKGTTFTVTLDLPVNPDACYELGISSVLLVSGDSELADNVHAPVDETDICLNVVATEEEARAYLECNSVDVVLLAGHLRDRTLGESVSLMRNIAQGSLLIYCVDFAQREEVQATLSQCDVDGLIARPFFLSNLEHALRLSRNNAALLPEGKSVLTGMRFLAAEDNELNQEILTSLLEMYGASCKICNDGQELVECFADVRPGDFDAILMDIQMPRMGGYDACRAVRTGGNPLGATIPIIAMTANAFSDDVERSMAVGMNAHISKPIDITLLEKAMEKLSVSPPPSAR